MQCVSEDDPVPLGVPNKQIPIVLFFHAWEQLPPFSFPPFSLHPSQLFVAPPAREFWLLGFFASFLLSFPALFHIAFSKKKTCYIYAFTVLVSDPRTCLVISYCPQTHW